MSIKVLYLEDKLSKGLMRYLKEYVGGFVFHYSSGKKAMESIKSQKISFDVIITDRLLDEMNADEFISFIRSEDCPTRYRATPIIVLTGYPCEIKGANKVLKKPTPIPTIEKILLSFGFNYKPLFRENQKTTKLF